jgi:hypothetical protein
MPTFDFTSLLWWGLPLAAAPVVIHLINLLRHRVVDWAAMEFLLASQRKYRTQILLKQLLLLLLRILAIAGLVAMLAQPRWTSALTSLLGGRRTIHVVLLDDSFSMGETFADAGGETTAFSRGRRMVERLLEELAGTPGRHELSLGRFSRLAAATDNTAPADGTTTPESADLPPETPQDSESQQLFDLRGELVTPQNLARLRQAVGDCRLSAFATGPTAAVRAAAAVFAGHDGGGAIWLITDLRRRDWLAAEDTVAALEPLAAVGIDIHLVDAAAEADEPATTTDPSPRPNLAIEQLEMVGGVPASDVLLPWEVTVRNLGPEPVRDVPLVIREDESERPGVQLDQILPGDTTVARFESRFPNAGGHFVEVELPVDRLVADNRRTAAVEVVNEADVLIIAAAPAVDSSVDDAFYLATALDPGAAAATGLRPRIEPPRALATLELDRFDSVWLVDVPRLDATEIEPLENYARRGGGVVFFTGPATQPELVNQTLFRDGSGIFPAPLADAVDLLTDQRNPDAPDVVAEDHPVVAILRGRRNPFLDAVRIDRYMAIQRSYQPPPDSGLRRLLSLRNQAPLAIEKPFGEGLAVVILTTAAPTWNSWARNNPSWVVVMLELEGQLARLRRRRENLLVGEPLTLSLTPGVDRIDVEFLLPPDGLLVRRTAEITAAGGLQAQLTETATPGGYTARWQTVTGEPLERVAAFNVNPAESALQRIAQPQLARLMAGVPYRYERADQLEPDSTSRGGSSLVRPLLVLLLVILLAEQLLGYLVSYHPRRRHG